MLTISRPVFLILTVSILMIGFAGYKYFSTAASPTWHMINVNSGKVQGDAHLITVGKQNILIDAGYKSEALLNLVPYLEQLGIEQIHHLFISHPHRDHYEGVAAIWDHIKIENLYIKVPPKEICDREIPWGCNYRHVQKFIRDLQHRNINVHHPITGFALDLSSNSSLKILHAQESDLEDVKIDVNDLSLIMQWQINNYKVLFTGDLNRKLGKKLANDPRMKADFLKMPHHGLTHLAPDIFFDNVDPEFVFVPGPKVHWCDKRGLKARNWLKNNGLKYWVNGLNGNVRVEFEKNNGKIIWEKNDSCTPSDPIVDSDKLEITF